ncbi:MAG: efflux RND transporter periplasmic adaptor subunit, partial [Isosphaeraceae bacterium]
CELSREPARESAAPRVVVVKSRRMTVPILVTPIGTTRALEDVTIRARVKGFLTEKHFKDGQQVKPGQLLLVIDPVPYQLQLRQAEAQLQAARASLASAQASKSKDVARAQVELDRAQTLLDQVEERRTRNLFSRRAASQEDLDRADAQLKKSTAQLAADQADLEQKRADYDINIDNNRAQVARADAAVEDASVNLGYTKMFAPIAGRIGELKVKVGNLVGDGQATELVTIQQLDPMGVDIRAAARHLPSATELLAKGGTPIRITVEGDRVHPHVGKMLFIDNAVDSTTSTFLVRVEVPNPDGSLLPGEYIQAEVRIGDYDGAIVVPEQAVAEGPEGARVFVVDAQNQVKAVNVQPLDHYRGLRVLEPGPEPGLQPDQQVVVEGIQLVSAGQAVAPAEAPLDSYIRDSQGPATLERRFSSPIAKLPGAAETNPPSKDGDARPRTTAPEPKPETKGK